MTAPCAFIVAGTAEFSVEGTGPDDHALRREVGERRVDLLCKLDHVSRSPSELWTVVSDVEVWEEPPGSKVGSRVAYEVSARFDDLSRAEAEEMAGEVQGFMMHCLDAGFAAVGGWNVKVIPVAETAPRKVKS